MKISTLVRSIPIALTTALVAGVSTPPTTAQSSTEAAKLFQAAHHEELVEGDLEEAITLYREALEAANGDRGLAARALLRIGRAYERLGREEATEAYRRLLAEYGDLEPADTARARLAALVEKPEPPEADEAVRAREVWRDAGDEGQVSRDGRYIAFIDWNTGDVAVRELATGIERRVTDKGPWSESSSFGEYPIPSPDARRIAYTWYPDGECCELRVIDIDGSNERTLIDSAGIAWVEAGGWSSDGGTLSVTIEHQEGQHRLVLVSVAGGSVTTLKRYAHRHLHPGPFSPNDRYVVYDFPPVEGERQRDVFVASVDGSSDTAIVSHPGNDRSLGWTPDGERVVFMTNRRGQVDIWSVPVESGSPAGPAELVQPAVGLEDNLGITRTGDLYYGVGENLQNVFSVPFDTEAVEIRGEPRPFTERFVGTNAMCAFSPDGSELAYFSWREQVPSPLAPTLLVVRDLTSGEERELELDATVRPNAQPRWTPEGDALLVIASQQQKRGLFRIDPSSGEAELVREVIEGGLHQPQFSPGGETLYLLEDNRRILAIDRKTGEERTVIELDGSRAVNVYAVSPDGRRIALRVMGNDYETVDRIHVVPASGGEAQEVLRQTVEKNTNIAGRVGLAWTPDGSHLLFGRYVDWPESENIQLWALEMTSGKTQPLDLVAANLRGVSLSPDGERLAFTGGARTSHVWVLENFLDPAGKD